MKIIETDEAIYYPVTDTYGFRDSHIYEKHYKDGKEGCWVEERDGKFVTIGHLGKSVEGSEAWMKDQGLR